MKNLKNKKYNHKADVLSTLQRYSALKVLILSYAAPLSTAIKPPNYRLIYSINYLPEVFEVLFAESLAVEVFAESF